jgi:hypothetical protein
MLVIILSGYSDEPWQFRQSVKPPVLSHGGSSGYVYIARLLESMFAIYGSCPNSMKVSISLATSLIDQRISFHQVEHQHILFRYVAQE